MELQTEMILSLSAHPHTTEHGKTLMPEANPERDYFFPFLTLIENSCQGAAMAFITYNLEWLNRHERNYLDGLCYSS